MGARSGRTIGIVVGLASLVVTNLATTEAARAQVPRSSVDVPASQTVAQFRDPKTGQIWTPFNVGQKSGPPTPQDLAFDPLGQAVYVKGVITQRPTIVPLSSVPITAGPTVPIVNIGDATLSAIPGKRWQLVVYLDNNSANTVAPLLTCRFANSGKLVEETHVLVPAVGAGLRVGMVIHGPKTDLFVDRATCAVKSP
ncbi:MAG: hypothetical protein FJX11_13590 [Alphaproteobacteria bacterium]|nr:hypothetical protein [Alphaproteobacteria bacterium]